MIVNLLLILLCIVLSAFFSGSEIAYSASQELRLEHAAKERGGAYALALKVKKSFEKALISILVGNNLVNIGASALATVIAIGIMGEKGAWAATAIMTLIIITFGEIGPKILASAQPERFSAVAAVPMRLWMGITWPFTWVLEKFLHFISRLWERGQDSGPAVTEDDLETIIETVEDEGVVDEDTADLLQSALDFGDVLAYEVITPRVDLVAIDLDDSREEMLKVKKSFEKALISILVGNNLVNIGASSLATVIAVGLMGEGGAWAATAIMTVLIITFGEIGPKEEGAYGGGHRRVRRDHGHPHHGGRAGAAGGGHLGRVRRDRGGVRGDQTPRLRGGRRYASR